jgi:hypothetical protein
LKRVSAPPDISITNDPAIDLDFTDSMDVYEIPDYLLLNIQELELRIGGSISDFFDI